MSVQGPSASTCPLMTRWPYAHDGLLVDAGVLVRALELGELVNVGAHLARKLAFMRRAFHAHDDALGIHRIHHARAFAQHHRAGIARRHVLHAGAHIRSVGAQQRNRLALHVRSHQRAVGVVVLKERNQARGHRDQLLGADVDVFDLFLGLSTKLPACRALQSSGTMRPFSSNSTLAWATIYLSSSHAERYSQWATYSAACFLALSCLLASSASARGAMSPTL